jgi:hypothetical protein
MTTYIHKLIFGCALNATNLERMQRLGYAAFTEGLTNQQRLDAINGTTPLATILASPESKNFMTQFTRSANPTGPEFIVGCGSLTPAHWARIQSRIAALPTTWRYLRAQTVDGTLFTVVECPEWVKLVGRTFENPMELLIEMGFTRWLG